ncbi:MAG: dihydropteroate synthase [Pseudomonadales bacterium]|nr:dihydropteroate synthase [Pseudomonadales bacterium]
MNISNPSRPLVMGILNSTPDSFSDGGQFCSLDHAIAQAERMHLAGADIIDIGGESTRPGATFVSAAEELDRVIPLIEKVRRELDVNISVDTSKAEVIKEAAVHGIDLINDVRALQQEGALDAAVKAQLPVCLMHMQGKPENMQANPDYDDLFTEISKFFKKRIATCVAAGLSAEKIILDPGFGFGKTPQHNLALINRLSEFKILGKALLVGLSRKSTIGMISGRDDRLIASVTGAVIAVQNGASIVRVHDVAETVEALATYQAIISEGRNL